MNRRLLLALSAVLFGTSPTAADSQAFPPMPPVGTPPSFVVPASETFRLPTGMQATLIPYGNVPKAVVSLRVYAGALNEGKDSGLAAFTAQMLREGAAGRSGSEIAAEAATMGGNIGLGSGMHETSLSLNVLSENAGDAIRLLADLVQRPDFPASEIDRVRQNLLRNVAVAKSQPQVAAEAALRSAYYGDHPYGRVLPQEAHLQAYTLDDLRRFHAQNFGGARARLYIAGQFDMAKVRAAIEEAFRTWTPGPARLNLPPQPRPGPKVVLVDRPGAPQSTIRLAFSAPIAGSSADLPFRVTNALLGGSFTSRITRNIREDKGYTYSPFSAVSHNPGEALWTFNADVTSADTANALREVFNEIKTLQESAPGEEEALGMRTWMAGTFVIQNAGPSGLVNSLAERDFHGLPANWLETFIPGLLGVNAVAIQQSARDRLPLERMTLVVVGDLGKIEPLLRAMPELANLPMIKVDPFHVR